MCTQVEPVFVELDNIDMFASHLRAITLVGNSIT